MRLAGGSRKPDSVANGRQAAADGAVTHREDGKQMRWVSRRPPCGWQRGLIRASCAHMANEQFTGWFREQATPSPSPAESKGFETRLHKELTAPPPPPSFSNQNHYKLHPRRRSEGLSFSPTHIQNNRGPAELSWLHRKEGSS